MSVTSHILPASIEETVPSEKKTAQILCLQAVHILLLSFLFYPMRASVLCASGAITLVLYSRLLHREVVRDPFGISPFILYLFLGWIRLGLIPIYLSAVVVFDRVDAVRFAGYDTSPYYIAGYHLGLLGDWFFLVGYFLVRRFYSPVKPLWIGNSVISLNALLTSAFSLLALVYGFRVAQFFEYSVTRFGQISDFIQAYGASAALLVLIFAIKQSSRAKRFPLVLFTAVVSLVELRIAFDSYMKQHAVVFVLPFFVYFLSTVRQSTPGFQTRILYKRLALLTITFFVFLSVLFTYSEMRRGAFWERGGVMRAQTPEISSYLFHALDSLVPGSETFRETHEFPNKGIWSILYRHALIVGDAWCYSFVEDNGTTDGLYFRRIPYILIPRFLWPEKPWVSYGRDIAVLLGQARSFEEATTATVFSMAGGFYWAWGYPSVIVGMFLNGLLFYLAWKIFSASIILSPVSSVVCIYLFVNALRHFEGIFDGNVIDYLLIFALFFPLTRLWDALLSKRQAGGGKQEVSILRSEY